MSILLEALRKSEKSQRPVAPPGINDDMPVASARRFTRPVLLMASMAVLLLVTGWFAWRQYRPPVQDDSPPVSVSAGQPASAANPAAGLAANQAHDARVTSAPPAGKSADGKRTPVEAYQKATRKLSTPVQKNAAKAAGAATVPASTPKTQGGQGGSRKSPKMAPAADTDTTVPPTGSDTSPFQAGEPAPISYWELPDSVRADVPEINYSVLVFAAEPADRFVLINGQRLAQGDSLPSGPKITEIRRDGIVFSYRLYRFLVER